MKILIIEDEAALVRILTDLLVRRGYEVQASFNGEDGLKNAASGKFDLIVLDVMLPRMDGFEVLEWLRSEPMIGRLPVAIVTDSDHDPYVDRAYRLGADSYLIKPPSQEELVALVQRLRTHWMIVTDVPEALAA